MVQEKRNKIKELNSVEINKASLATERLKARRKKAQAIQIEKQKALQEAKQKEQRLKKGEIKIDLNDPKYKHLKKMGTEYDLLKKEKPQTSEDKKIHQEKLALLGGELRKEFYKVEAQRTKKEQVLTQGRTSATERLRQRREREKTNSRGFSMGR